MRRCRQREQLTSALAAEEPISRELSGHAASCADCTAVLAAGRRFEGHLQAAMDQLITDALPPETLAAARMGAPAGRRSQLPRLVLSGLSAAALLLFAAVGVAATGVGVLGALADRSPVTEGELRHGNFSECYVTEVLARGHDHASGETATVEHCLVDVSGGTLTGDYEAVAIINREAEETSACLRARGWDIEPELEPDGRFLIPPASPPTGGDDELYLRDMQACAAEGR